MPLIELPSCHEGELLVQALNTFLSQIRQEAEKFNGESSETAEETLEPIEFLQDPQLAAAMREGTKVVHRAAENSVFTR